MDERKKAILELEDKKQANQEGVDRLLETLGGDLLGRMEGGAAGEPDERIDDAGAEKAGETTPDGARREYRRLHREIAACEENVTVVESDMRHYKGLEEEIAAGEKENSEKQKELVLFYVQLGQYLMVDPAFDEFTAPFKGRAEGILDKIDTHIAKIGELEEKSGGFFSWLGKNAQGAVAKAFLVKGQGDLNKVYRAVGEKFIAAGATSGDGEADGGGEVWELAEKTKKFRQAVQDLTDEAGRLREERRRMGEGFTGADNPNRRIQALERQIAGAKDSLSTVCRRFGAYALDAAWEAYFAPVLTEENISTGGKINLLRESVKESGIRIEKLRIAMAIDGEKAGIEKMRLSMGVQRHRIADAEKEIADLETKIAGAEKRVEELEMKRTSLS
jgi:chromosome segregation ATPase